MSNAVFPSLPGIGSKIVREPYTDVTVTEAVSGKEYRSTWWGSARVRYRIPLEYLYATTTRQELQQLVSFFARHFGQLDSFLLSDPEDCTVTDHGCAVGDGSTTTFQLQRSLLGDVYDALGGPWAVSPKPRTNLCTYSQEWSATGWGYTGIVITPDCAVAPDGTATADLIRVTSTNHLLRPATMTVKPGTTYVWSFWAKNAGGSSAKYGIYDLSAGVDIVPVTSYFEQLSSSAWRRVQVAFTTPAGCTQVNCYPLRYSGTADAAIYGWGAQLEEGSTPTQYIPTTSAAVRSIPSYWPAYGDGFEPIHEPQWSTVQLTQEGDWQGKRLLYPWARTNLLLRSQEFDNSVWLKSASTVTANATTAPDGTLTAEKYTETTATATIHALTQTFAATAGVLYTASVYLKAGERSVQQLALSSGAFPTNVLAKFDLAAGTAFAPTGPGTSTITPLGNGWYRCTVTAPAQVTGSALFSIELCDSVPTHVYDGDGTSGAYAWGAQLEVTSAATGYIPTTTAAVSVTDYTMGANGAVTLAAAPPSGACLAWSGSYYRRVRFAGRGLSTERIVQQLWKAGAIELVSVKP